MTMPKYGNGVGAGKLGSTSQTIGITLVVAVQAAGRGLHHVHAHAGQSWSLFYKDTGALPADDRFDANADHGAAGEAAVSTTSQNGAPVPRELHPDRSRREGQLRRRAADVRRQDDAAEGGRRRLEKTWRGSGRSSLT